MNDYLKKTYNLLSLLPSNFYLSFLIYLIFALLVVFFEIIAISFLMPLLTMLSNNNFDPSQFSNFVNNINDFAIRNFSINILKNIVNLAITIFSIFLIKVIIQFISLWVSSKRKLNLAQAGLPYACSSPHAQICALVQVSPSLHPQ